MGSEKGGGGGEIWIYGLLADLGICSLGMLGNSRENKRNRIKITLTRYVEIFKIAEKETNMCSLSHRVS